jgi:putative transposase
MPRQARLDSPGLLHHVINRGMERRNIFVHRSDYLFFVEALAELVSQNGYRLFAWVLMPNHFHLLLETGPRPLSELMNRLSTRYAGYFNRKHKRAGRLFQNRFKSIVCDRDVYFKELIAYIHLNPRKGRLVKSMEELSAYPWSGHRALMGFEKSPWMAVNDSLEAFGALGGQARKNYFDFLSRKKRVRVNLSGGGLIRSAGGLEVVMRRAKADRDAYDTRVLGSGDFVEKVLPREEGRTKVFRDPDAARRVMKKVEEFFNISKGDCSRPGKSSRIGNEARSVAAYLLVERCGWKKIAVADLFKISQPAVSRLYTQGLEKKNEIQVISSAAGV